MRCTVDCSRRHECVTAVYRPSMFGSTGGASDRGSARHEHGESEDAAARIRAAAAGAPTATASYFDPSQSLGHAMTMMGENEESNDARGAAIEDMLIFWSFAHEGVFKVTNDASHWDDSECSAFKKLISDGLRVLLHKEMETASGRITRVRRIMMLLDGALRFCTVEGETLVDEGEGVLLSEIDYVCVGPCSSTCRSSLESLHGKLYSLDAMEQSKRVFSVFAQGRSIDIEVRPSAPQSRPKNVNEREERWAAQDISFCCARTIQRLSKETRCASGGEGMRNDTHTDALEIVPLEAYAGLLKYDVQDSDKSGIGTPQPQFKQRRDRG